MPETDFGYNGGMSNSDPPVFKLVRPARHPQAVLDAVAEGRDLSVADALVLLGLREKESLERLRTLANQARQRQCGHRAVVRESASLFLTNQCQMAPCLYPYPFPSGDSRAFMRDIDWVDARLENAVSRQATEIKLSGGGFCPDLHIRGLSSPNLLQTYARLCAHIRERYPSLRLSGFSPDEIIFLSIISGRSPRYVLELMHDHGLTVLGGYGSEILDDALRRRISPRKASVADWLAVAAWAARLRLPVQARIECGPLESPAQRVEHLAVLRRFLQRYAGGLESLTPQLWTLKPPASPALGNGHAPPAVQPQDALTLTAVARLFLGDCLPQQAACWRTEEPEAAIEALCWGASDLGDTDALAYRRFLAGQDEAAWVNREKLTDWLRQAGREPA